MGFEVDKVTLRLDSYWAFWFSLLMSWRPGAITIRSSISDDV